ncbi:MAG: GIY-YIG nuclease family protein [Patescibacteria group bacterium]
MISKQYFVYLMTNTYNTVVYAGVTNDLIRRVYEHKQEITGFTAKYKLTKLVYFEAYNDVQEAIKREKQIKGGSRKKKIDLITKENSQFQDLYDEIIL